MFQQSELAKSSGYQPKLAFLEHNSFFLSLSLGYTSAGNPIDVILHKNTLNFARNQFDSATADSCILILGLFEL